MAPGLWDLSLCSCGTCPLLSTLHLCSPSHRSRWDLDELISHAPWWGGGGATFQPNQPAY